jgi:hypothetical protein
MSVQHKLQNVGRGVSLFDRRAIVAIPNVEKDFIPAVRQDRVELVMTTLFGETMSKKNASSGDAQQKKG